MAICRVCRPWSLGLFEQMWIYRTTSRTSTRKLQGVHEQCWDSNQTEDQVQCHCSTGPDYSHQPTNFLECNQNPPETRSCLIPPAENIETETETIANWDQDRVILVNQSQMEPKQPFLHVPMWGPSWPTRSWTSPMKSLVSTNMWLTKASLMMPLDGQGRLVPPGPKLVPLIPPLQRL